MKRAPTLWVVLRYDATEDGITMNAAALTDSAQSGADLANVLNAKSWVAGRRWYELQKYVPAPVAVKKGRRR